MTPCWRRPYVPAVPPSPLRHALLPASFCRGLPTGLEGPPEASEGYIHLEPFRLQLQHNLWTNRYISFPFREPQCQRHLSACPHLVFRAPREASGWCAGAAREFAMSAVTAATTAASSSVSTLPLSTATATTRLSRAVLLH